MIDSPLPLFQFGARVEERLRALPFQLSQGIPPNLADGKGLLVVEGLKTVGLDEGEVHQREEQGQEGQRGDPHLSPGAEGKEKGESEGPEGGGVDEPSHTEGVTSPPLGECGIEEDLQGEGGQKPEGGDAPDPPSGRGKEADNGQEREGVPGEEAVKG